jgi:hypothetical protein
MEKILQQGKGWRIGWNPIAEVYRGLIGGDDWAIELTIEEWNDFHRLLGQLSTTMEAMQGELMEEERIALAGESTLLWLEGEGFPRAYSLRILLHHGRRCEGNWSAEVVPELVRAIERFRYNS